MPEMCCCVTLAANNVRLYRLCVKTYPQPGWNKRRIARTVLCVLALAVLLTGCAKSADSAAVANVQMRVQDGYIQYYNGTDWENLISTEELKGEKGDKGDKGDKGATGATGPQGPKGPAGVTFTLSGTVLYITTT